MIQGRTADEVRRYDNFKLGVLLLLILLLLCMIFNQCSGQPIVPPTVNVPNSGQALTGEEIDLTGTGQADSDLQIVVDNDVIGNTNVGNNGQWAYTAQLDEPGDYDVTVQTINESGEVLATSEAAKLSVEMATVEIDAPTINLPSGAFFANQAISLDGSGSPDYGLQVLLNGEVSGDAEMGANGQWSYNTEISEPGEYEVTVESIDTDGTVLAASDSAFLAVADFTALTLDLPSGGQVNSGEEMSLSGTAPAGAEVEISVDGQVVGTTTADADGTWSFATQIDEAGDHDISVRALDASGSALASVDPKTISVAGADASSDPGSDPANALTLSLPSADEIGADEEIALSGRGTPGQDVEILVDGEVVGTTTVGDDGTWSFATQISDPGEHDISVQALDADGAVVDVSDAGTLSIVAAAPDGDAGALALNLPATDAPLSAGRVRLTGTGTPGDEVEVLVDGEAVGRTRVRPDGTWSLATRLDDPGDYEVSVQALDADGSVTATADPATFSIADAGALTLNLPSATDAVSGEEITLSGEGEPGTEVEILVDGEVVGTTTVDEDGKWSLSTTINEPGDHDIRAQALDADGNVAVSSDALALSVAEPGSLTANLPGYGLPLSAGVATFAGLGLPGSDVQVVVDGEVVGTTTVGDDGRWSLDANLENPGSYDVVIDQLDADGNVVSSSDPSTIEIADTELTVDLPDADALASGEGVTLSGTGEPGSEVQVVADGEVIGTATVDADGKWSFPNANIDANSRDIRAQAVDENGSILASSNNPLLAGGTAAAAAGEGEGEGEGEGAGAGTGALTLNLPVDDAPLSAGDATFSGEGTPGSEIQVVVDGEVVGSTTVAPDGTWNWTGELQEPGEYEVTVQEVDGDGEVVSQSEPSPLTIADGAPLTVDLPDGGVALSGEDITLSGTGEPGSEVEVLVDGEVAGTATVDEDGNWSLPIALTDAGPRDIRIQAVDASGAVQASSNPATLAIADAGELMMQVPNDGSLSAGDVTLNGTAEPGAEVQVLLDGEVVGSTTAGDDGKWSFTTPIADPGQYEVSAQVVDAGGEVVASSDAAALNIGGGDGSGAAPGEGTASLGTLTIPGSISANEPTTLSGTGTPGADVQILVDGEVVGTTTVDEEGNWTFDTTFDAEGDYEVSAQIVDDGDNVVAESKPTPLTVGGVAAPTVELPASASAGDEITLTGTGTPGSQVQIVLNGDVAGTADVAEDGTWSFATLVDEAGEYDVLVQSLDGTGEAVADSDGASLSVAAADAVVPTLTLPTAASAGENVTLTGTGEPGSTLQITIDGEVVGTTDVDSDGNWSFDSVLDDAGDYAVSVQSLDDAGDVAAASEGASLSVAAADAVVPTLTLPTAATAGENVTFTGTGEPGSTLQITIDGEVVGTTDVDSDGNWSFDSVLDDAGDYAVSVQSLDGAGDVAVASEGASLSVAAADAVVPTLTLPTAATAGENVTFTGTGEPGSTLQITIDGEIVGTTDVDSDGNWSFDSVLDDAGDYAVSVQSLDGAGDVAVGTDDAALSVVAAAGLAPTLILPASAIAGENVTLTGTGEPGSTLQIIIDGEVVGTTDVDSDGNWSFDSVLDNAGDYAVTVQSLDDTSAVAKGIEGTLSVTEAAGANAVAPTLAQPANATAGDNVTFTGTGEPGSTLQIIIDGEVVGTTDVDSDGNWSFDSVLNDAGNYAVSVQSIDGNQQVIAKSDAATLTLAAADDAGGTDDGNAEAGDGQKPTKVTCTTDHIVQTDDWLRDLATNYWGDFTLYPAIVEGTNVKNAEDDSYNYIENPNRIYPGWKLCIVDADTARLLLQ